MLQFIKNRNGDIIKFNPQKIFIAIQKAYSVFNIKNDKEINNILKEIIDNLNIQYKNLKDEKFITVEDIQDTVEKFLMKFEKFDIAKQYIIYRNEHNKIREKKKQEEYNKLTKHKLKVTKRNKSEEFFDINKIKKTYLKIIGNLENRCPFDELEKELKKYIIDGIKTSDIIKLLIKSSVNLISIENIDWQEVAGRFLTIDLYKKVSKERNIKIKDLYSPKNYADFVIEYIKDGRYSEKFSDNYKYEDLLEAGKIINSNRDMEYGYTTLMMFNKRYLCNPNGIFKELPQYMYLSIALFLAIPEKKENRLKIAKEFYEILSKQELSLATPCLMNARRKFHQLSSCFVLTMGDDLRSIYHNIENIAQISKYGGGVGVYMGHIRSKGSSIRGVKGVGGGVVPWIKVINDTAIAVNQQGARAGAVSVTTDIWNLDIQDFLDMQTETGDTRRKCFDIFPAISIPNLFMKRLENNEMRTLFDPKEILDITGKRIEDLYGDNFEKFYIECEKNSKIKNKKTILAKNLFKTFLKVVVETGMPYVFFRDTVNEQNPNKHAGMIYSTQLCTEITQNMSESVFLEEKDDDGNLIIKYKMGDTVICNLASLNMAKVWKEEDIKRVIPLSMRLLDNVIDLNFFPLTEIEKTAMKYRSVGLGFLGLAEHLATNKIIYDSKDAIEYVDKLFEKYSYYVIKSSNDLAKERGHYKMFPGSEWSKGLIFGKDKKYFGKYSNISKKWNDLIDDIIKYGLRFAYHMSPAPNTSTANVVGTTAGLLPIYKKYYVYTDAVAPTINVAPKLNKDNFWYYKEYVNMKMPEVIEVISTIQKRIDQSISFEWIINPSNTSPKDLYGYYMKGWKEGLKTIYYVRSMTLDVKECISCSG